MSVNTQVSPSSDDLSPYEGSWVAIRDGRVVASALNPVELQNNDLVLPTDVLLLVPEKSANLLLL